MKKTILLSLLCVVAMITACNNTDTKSSAMPTSDTTEEVSKDDTVVAMADTAGGLDFAAIEEYIKPKGVRMVDTLCGYSTFSANNKVVIVPELITKEEYERLITDVYTIKPEEISDTSARFKRLLKMALPGERRYNIIGESIDETLPDSVRNKYEFWIESIYYFPETKQYQCDIFAPLTTESFMMTEKGVLDSTFMQSQTRTYGKNKIFVGQMGHDCDFCGSLFFYRFDEQQNRMIHICQYVDLRWHEDYEDFNLCWINDNTLLVAALSTGNTYNKHGWVENSKLQKVIPHGTKVYYKLRFTIN